MSALTGWETDVLRVPKYEGRSLGLLGVGLSHPGSDTEPEEPIVRRYDAWLDEYPIRTLAAFVAAYFRQDSDHTSLLEKSSYTFLAPLPVCRFIYLPYQFDTDKTGLLGPARLITGVPYSSPLDQSLSGDDGVAQELKSIRDKTALSVSDVARLCGLKRRQIYNLLDGEPTESHRAARIRKLAAAISRWARRIPEPTRLRSALLAPLDDKQRDFITIVSSDEPNAERTAIALFNAYLDKLDSSRPIARATSQKASDERESLRNLRELYGEASNSSKDR